MKKLLFVIIYLSIISNAAASIKGNIIKKFTDIKNISLDFEQNINGKVENGNCIIRCDKLYYRPLEVDSLKGNSSKAIKKLNWKAKYTIKTLIKEMVEIEFKNLNKIDS